MNPRNEPWKLRLCGKAGSIAALIWGISEASFFFFAPDVLLTFIAASCFRASLKAAVFAVIGGLIGGALMMTWAGQEPEAAREFLLSVPGISAPMIEEAATQCTEYGAAALMLGTTRGRAYKIYAVESGAQKNSLVTFLALSIPARYLRFFLSMGFVAGVFRLLRRWTRGSWPREMAILAALWIAFYLLYFYIFGW